MKIIGIDPGYQRCGFAILTHKKGVTNLENYGVITTQPHHNFPLRQDEIAQDFKALLDRYKPNICSIEDLFFAQNVTTGLKVAQIRGILIYLAHQSGCQIVEPKPVEIKKTFCGNGQADKKEMQRMCQLIFKLPQAPTVDDAADAIAAGFFATQNTRFLS